MKIESTIIKILERFKKENLTFRELGTLFVIGAIANGYFLSNFSFSIDDEMGATRKDPSVWIAQGRWTVYLVERFLFPQPSIPFAPYILLIACLGIAYALLIRTHNLQVSWKTYAAYSIFCTFPTWWFICEFYSNVPAVAFGVLLTSLGVYITFWNAEGTAFAAPLRLSNALGVVFLLACAVGAYQSMILMYVCMSLGVVVVKLLSLNQHGNAVVRQVIATAARTILLALGGLVLYAVINFAAQKISGAHSTYIDSFVNIQSFLQSPAHRVASVLIEEWNIYAGSASLFGAAMPLASIMLIGATAIIFYSAGRNLAITLLVWFVALTIPFSLNFLSGTEAMPIRSMLALAYITWLMAIILLSQKRMAGLLVGAAIVGFYQLEVVSVTSQYIASATVTQAHDRMVAADIYRRIGELSNDFDRNKPCLVDFYGHMGVRTVYATGWSSAMQGSFFDWENGNSIRMGNYLKVMGYENLQIIDRPESRLLTPLYQGMPAWPAAGSVKKVGDKYLVKLSHDPDPIHAKFGQ